MKYTAKDARDLAASVIQKEREECQRKTEEWCNSYVIEQIKKAASDGRMTLELRCYTPINVSRDKVCRYLRSLGYSATIIAGGYLIKW